MTENRQERQSADTRASEAERPGASIRPVRRLVRGQPTSDGAGVRLTRVIGTAVLSDLDPFLMLDEFRSDQASDYIAGFPEHPHRGFETVTYMLAGCMRHGDNQGNRGLLQAGSAQWMTAGRGIVHSEMPEQENGLMWGFQLWVNLPAKDKMTAPRYQDIPPDAIPTVARPDGVAVRVIAGRVGETEGAVRAVVTDPEVLFLDEPLSGIHHQVTDNMLDLIRELKRKGRTIIIVTHDPQLTSQVADWLVVLQGGRILECGPTMEVVSSSNPEVIAILTRVLSQASTFDGSILDILDQGLET